MKYIDLHCDTLSRAWQEKKKDITTFPTAMADVERLKNTGCMGQFFAIFMPQPPEKDHGITDENYIESLLKIFECSRGSLLEKACGWEDVRRNWEQGKVSGILTLEDGRALNGRMENLERFYELGIRLVSLTWNYPNCLGYPNSSSPAEMARGLTVFGKDAVRRMQELGVLVDVSHLSDGGFWDVAELCREPFLASHSNCRALNPHPRSLSDEMLRTIADRGGVAGVNFCPQFLTADVHAQDSRVEDIVRHLRHMLQVGGEDCPAIGSDLDGIEGRIQLDSADKMPLLLQALERAGFSPPQIEKIAWKNAARMLEQMDR